MNALRGQTVLVTGASRGIGHATARAFLQEGARVALCARDPQRLRDAEQALAEEGEVAGFAADVRDPAQLGEAFDAAAARLGPVEVLVNNAGALWVGAFAEQPLESITQMLDVNVKGVLHATRLVLPAMLERGAGVIVNVASGAGLSGIPELVTYSASKFAVVGFTETLQAELGERGLRVHAVCPGKVATDMQVLYSGRKVGIAPEHVAERIVALAAGRGGRPGRCVTVG